LEDPSADGRIILKWIFEEVGWKGMDRNNLAQDSAKKCLFLALLLLLIWRLRLNCEDRNVIEKEERDDFCA
jgi:hypothetical protein